jgi:hypothetical protein
MKLGGLLGTITFDGDLASFTALLRTAEDPRRQGGDVRAGVGGGGGASEVRPVVHSLKENLAMVKRQIQLTDEQASRLEDIAKQEGRSVPDLLQARVVEFLRLEEKPAPGASRRRAAALSGRFHSGLSDLSTEHDRYLEEAFRD